MTSRFARWFSVGAVALAIAATSSTASAQQAPNDQVGSVRVVHGLRGLVADIYLDGMHDFEAELAALRGRLRRLLFDGIVNSFHAINRLRNQRRRRDEHRGGCDQGDDKCPGREEPPSFMRGAPGHRDQHAQCPRGETAHGQFLDRAARAQS